MEPPLSMEPPSLSYRQTGKATKGTLMRGKLTGQGQSGGRNFSTIPSKFETTLFTGNKEKDGFGSRAHRFVDMENDLPGPGTYNEHEQKIQDDKVYSKKGLGVGFVSKMKRESAFKATSSAPGPGNYERGASFIDSIKETNRANRSGSTSTFKPPTERSVLVAEEPRPGPADYTVGRELDLPPPAASTGYKARQDSVFCSRTTRGGKGGASLMPAPGQYEPEAISGGSAVDAMLPTAAFRSNVPVAGRTKTERLTREQQLGVMPKPVGGTVGPGAYEIPATSLQAPGYRRMPQFFDSGHDRFGKVITGAAPAVSLNTPGPGAYLAANTDRETAVLSSAVFMSGTARQGHAGREVVPGPAYYQPAPNGRKSYHLNARQRWMPAS